MSHRVLAALTQGCATTKQLGVKLGMTTGQVGRAIRTLRDRGLVCTSTGVHELTDKGRAWIDAGLTIKSGPRPGRAGTRTSGTMRAWAWRYLRMKGKANMDDLLFLLADSHEKDPAQNLRRYLNALVRAGILHQVRSGWVLTKDKDTGPLAPSWNSATRRVIDVNTGEQWQIG